MAKSKSSIFIILTILFLGACRSAELEPMPTLMALPQPTTVANNVAPTEVPSIITETDEPDIGTMPTMPDNIVLEDNASVTNESETESIITVVENVPVTVAEIQQPIIPEQIEETNIQFMPNTSQAEIDSYLESIDVEVVGSVDVLNTVTIRTSQANLIESSPLIASTEPNYYVSALLTIQTPTNDPYYSQQYALEAMNIPQYWASLPESPEPVTVAVIDSGICADHPDLVGRVLAGYDFVENDNTPQDDFGHGCAVAGVIAANINNGIGIAGVAPHAQIMPLRVLDGNGVGTYANVAAAIVYAVDNGADIINLSLGGNNPSNTLETAVNYANDNGVRIVAAAGNTGASMPMYPARYDAVVSVGALDANGDIASFSNRGADVYAPGVNIITLSNDGNYTFHSGTSFSSPEISALINLQIVDTQYPELNETEEPTDNTIVENTVDPIDTQVYSNEDYDISFTYPIEFQTIEWPANSIDLFSVSVISLPDVEDVLVDPGGSELLSLAIREKEGSETLKSWMIRVATENESQPGLEQVYDFFNIRDLIWINEKSATFVELRAGQAVSTFVYDRGNDVVIAWMSYTVSSLSEHQSEILQDLKVQKGTIQPFSQQDITRAVFYTSAFSTQLQVSNVTQQETVSGYYLPWEANSSYVVTQGWGPDPCPGCTSHDVQPDYHAYDFGLPEGTAVLASRAGTVTYVRGDVDKDTCGGSSLANNANYVIIAHSDGTATEYWHLQNVSVGLNAIVKQGQQIGTSGKTGWSGCWAQLHFKRQEQGGSHTNSRAIYFEEYPGQTFVWTSPPTLLTSSNSDVVAVTTAWNFITAPGEPPKWRANYQITEDKPVSNGYQYQVTGGDSQIISPTVDFNARDYKYLYVQMASQNTQVDNRGRIYFQREGDSVFKEERSFGFLITNGGSTGGYKIDIEAAMGANYNLWNGKIKSIRLDPAVTPVSPYGVRLEYIRFADDPFVWDFKAEQDDLGWQPINPALVSKSFNSIGWRLDIKNSDPYVISPPIYVDSATTRYVKVTQKLNANATCKNIRLFVDTTGGGNSSFTQGNSVGLDTLVQGSEIREYYFDTHTVTGGSGYIKQIRLDPWDCTSTPTTGTLDLQRIEFTNIAPQSSYTIPNGDVATLIVAVEQANAAGATVTINLASNGTYEFNSTYSSSQALPTITGDIAIVGNNAVIQRNLTAPLMRLSKVTSIGKLRIENTTIQDFDTGGSDGGVLDSTGTVEIIQSTFNNNKADDGAVVLNRSASSSLLIEDSFFTNNTALKAAGALWLRYGTATITGTEFSNNHAGTGGGAILISSTMSSASIATSTFSANTSDNNGAAIYAHGNFTIQTSTFANNTAVNDDGAIYFNRADGDVANLISAIVTANATRTTATINLANNGIYEFDTFYAGNRALPSVAIAGDIVIVGNGAILKRNTSVPSMRLINVGSGGKLRIEDTIIQDFDTGGGDAGVINNSDGTLEIIRSTFNNNKADDGAVILNASANSSLLIEDSIFSNNSAIDAAGALWLRYGTANISGTTFSNNHAGTDGGAIAISSPMVSVTITSSLFSSNTSGNRGAAIFADANFTLQDSTFNNNTAGGDGGAVYVDAATVNISDTSMVNNQAVYGGGLYNGYGTIIMDGGIISDNLADYGGAIRNYQGILDIDNVKFLYNNAQITAGGIYNSSDNGVSINNSCFVDNNFSAIDQQGSSTIVAENNWFGSASGPSGKYAGSGDAVSTLVDASPFLTSSIFNCPDSTVVITPLDDFEGAVEITSLPFTYNADTTVATNSPSDPQSTCGNLDQLTIWFAFTPTTTMWLELNTFTSDYNTVLSLWTGTQSSLIEHTCNDQASGDQSQFFANVIAGTTYYIMVAGYEGDSGNLILNAKELIDGTLSGTVFDDTGIIPLSGIQVYASGDGVGVATCANSNGDYTLDSLPFNVTLTLQAGLSCTNPDDYMSEYWQGTYNDWESTAITLLSSAPNQTDIDFALTRRGSIAGIVTDIDGNSLDNIQINLDADNGTFFDYVCSTNGTYEFTYVPANVAFRITASNETLYGDCSNSDGFITDYWQNAMTFDSATLVTLTSGNLDRSDINFSLLTVGSISGSIFDEFGTPLSNTYVSVIANGIPVGWDYVFNNETTYMIDGLPLDTPLYVSASSYTNAMGEEWYLDTHELTYAMPIPLTELDAHITDINFTLEPTGSISGTVYDRYGTPLPNVPVQIDGLLNTYCTDTNGTFTIYNLVDGKPYYLKAGGIGCFDDSYAEEWYRGALSRSTAQVVTAANPSAVADFYLGVPDATISGYVYDDFNKIPVENLEVVRYRRGGALDKRTTCTDAKGFYEFNGLPYDVENVIYTTGKLCSNNGDVLDYTPEYHLNEDNFADALGYTFVQNSQEYYPSVNLDIVPLGTISGQVVNSGNGQGLSFRTVFVRDQNNTSIAIPWKGITGETSDVCTDADGYFTIEDMPAGKQIYVYADGSDTKNCGTNIGVTHVKQYWQGVTNLVSATPLLITQPQQSIGAIDFSLISLASSPTTPPSLSFVNIVIGQETLNLEWVDNSNDETEFRIERSPSGTDTWVQISTVSTNVTSYLDTNATLGCYTAYDYRVSAYRSSDSTVSQPSPIATGTTSCLTVYAPTNLTGTSSANTMRLSWTDNAPDEDNFQIQRADAGQNNWSTLGTSTVNVTTYNDTTTACGDDYDYRVRAQRGATNSAFSNVFTIQQTCVPPPAPSLTVTALPFTNDIQLDWADNSTSETNFTIERSIDGINDWALISTVGENVITYTDTDASLSCYAPYYYRVRAYRNDDGVSSADSNIANVSTWCDPDIVTGLPLNASQSTSDISGLVSFPQPSCASGMSYAYVWEYTPAQNLTLNVNTFGSSFDTVLSVWLYNGTFGQVACNDDSAIDGTSATTVSLVAGSRYILLVGGKNNESGIITLNSAENVPPTATFTPTITPTLTSTPTPNLTTVGLFKDGMWLFRDSNQTGTADVTIRFGTNMGADWLPLVGDWNGDSIDSIGLYRNGRWLLRDIVDGGSSADYTFMFGVNEAGWQPVVGDWNGDGLDGIGLYKDGIWMLKNDLSRGDADYSFRFNPTGSPDVIAIAGDWHDESVDRVGLYKDGRWFLSYGHRTSNDAKIFQYGPTDGSWQPIVGDWDEDGDDTVGVYKESGWRLRNSNSRGNADLGMTFGLEGAVPIAGYRGNINALVLFASIPDTFTSFTEPTAIPAVTLTDKPELIIPTAGSATDEDNVIIPTTGATASPTSTLTSTWTQTATLEPTDSMVESTSTLLPTLSPTWTETPTLVSPIIPTATGTPTQEPLIIPNNISGT